jgi:LacI family transcriptional regulator
MERLLSRKGHRPSAVFAHNDWMAIGAIDVLRAHGLACPSDVSVIGYNDAPLSDHLSPPLSSIRYAAREIGRAAAEVALTRIEDPTAGSVSVSFAPELVIRESTAPPPKAAPLQAPLRARRRAGAKG